MALIPNHWTTTPTIFPRLLPELDDQIILFLKSREKVMLSGVSHRAYVVLSNPDYFKSFIEKQYPILQPLTLTFETLSNFHPTNCWKIVSCSLSKGIFQVNTPFIKEAAPLILNWLKKEKNRLEAELNEICGYSDSDPCSPIEVALKAFQHYKQEVNATQKKWEEAGLEDSMKKIKFHHPNEELRDVLNLCFNYRDYFFSNDDETLTPSDEKLKLINPNLINNYRIVSSALQECNPSIVKKMEWEAEYNRIEELRSSFVHSLKIVNEDISTLIFSDKPLEELNSVLKKHQKILEDEFYSARSRTASIV